MISSIARTSFRRTGTALPALSRSSPRSFAASARRLEGEVKPLQTKEPGLNDHFGYSAKAFVNENSQMYFFYAACLLTGVIAGSIFGGKGDPTAAKTHGGTQYREGGVESGHSVVPGEPGKANSFSKSTPRQSSA